MCPMLVLYVALMCTAWTLDQRTRYTTAMPHWADPGALGLPLWNPYPNPIALTLTLTLTLTL